VREVKDLKESSWKTQGEKDMSKLKRRKEEKGEGLDEKMS
jgi:hypothetical protein